MNHALRRLESRALQTVAMAGTVIALSAFLARRASQRLFIPLAGGLGMAVVLQHPPLGLVAMVFVALLVPMQIGTGTEVSLNVAFMMVPALLGVWVLERARQREVWWVPSPVNRPLFLFLAAGLVSLAAGNALWDPAVPRPSNLLVVQFGQWGIFAFSAGAFWLAANWIQEEHWLRRLTFFFLALAGALSVVRVLPGFWALVGRLATTAVDRATFWICLIALAGGQWLFNRRLTGHARWALLIILLAAAYYGLVILRESISTWVPSAVALAALVWLRFPRLRRLMLVVGGPGLVFFFSSLYEFAGGDPEWILSGGSRLVLIRRVVEEAMRNPILGLGPASYRFYVNIKPLLYRGALWWHPAISSHNNYVDIFAHTGLVGLGLFLWFIVELTRLGWRLHQRHREGFLAGYVNGMLAALVALLVAMMLADWFLPFVYNIGFPGFQASVLAWMFLGGLVAVDNLDRERGRLGDGETG